MANKRTFAEIASEIQKVWGSKMYFGAKPYIDTMMCLNTTDPKECYGLDSARYVVSYALANMSTFRGDDAKRIKAELKAMIK